MPPFTQPDNLSARSGILELDLKSIFIKKLRSKVQFQSDLISTKMCLY